MLDKARPIIVPLISTDVDGMLLERSLRSLFYGDGQATKLNMAKRETEPRVDRTISHLPRLLVFTSCGRRHDAFTRSETATAGHGRRCPCFRIARDVIPPGGEVDISSLTIRRAFSPTTISVQTVHFFMSAESDTLV